MYRFERNVFMKISNISIAKRY